MDERSVYTPVNPQKVTMSSVTARSAVIGSVVTGIGSRKFRMNATCPFFFKLGDAAVVATVNDNYSDGSLEYLDRSGYTHMAFILASDTGTCYISELS